MTLLECIKNNLKKGKLSRSFRGVDIKRVCPGFAEHTYWNFLPKHEVTRKNRHPKYFKQNKDGLYSIL